MKNNTLKKIVDVFSETRKEKNLILKISILSLLMFLSIYVLSLVYNWLIIKNQLALSKSSLSVTPQIIVILLFSFVYSCIVIFIYSVFKIMAINLTQKKKINRKIFYYLGNFFILNLIIFFGGSAAFLILGTIINYTFNGRIIPYSVYLFIFLLFTYGATNFTQIEFLKGAKKIKAIRNGVKDFFLNFKKYALLIFINFIVIAGILTFFLFLKMIYKIIFFKNNTQIIKPTAYEAAFFFIFYFVIIFMMSNNLYFFNKIVKEKSL
ncbi:MAG: hypothetical protein QXG86_00270 [Candidatus Woesearchaeota archaeon]